MNKALMLMVILAVAALGAWMYFSQPAQVSAPQAPVGVSPAPTAPQVPALDTNDNLTDALKDLDAVKQL